MPNICKYLICVDGSEASIKALEFAKNKINPSDHVVLYSAYTTTNGTPRLDWFNPSDAEITLRLHQEHKENEKQTIREHYNKLLLESKKKLEGIDHLTMVMDDTNDIKESIVKYAEEHGIDNIVSSGSH